MPAPQEIIDRIRKLEAMAKDGNASEGEIDNALRFIRQLRDKYDVSDAEVAASARAAREPIVNQAAMEWNRMMPWQRSLGTCIAKLFDCGWFIGNNHKGYTKKGTPRMYKSVRFYGRQRDVDVACQVYEVTYYTMRMMASMRYGGGNHTVQHTSYMDGICNRLWDRIIKMVSEARENDEVNAIVLVKDKEIADYRRALCLKPIKTGTRKIDRNAQAAGYADGAKLDITPSDRKAAGRGQRRLT